MSTPQHTAAMFHPDVRRKAVQWIVDQIRNINPEAIMVCGQSGIIPGVLVSDRLNLPLVIVRKRGEPTQAGPSAVNWDGRESYGRWLWLDDCVSSGTTFEQAAEDALAAGAITSMVPAAVVLYHNWRSSPRTFIKLGYGWPEAVDVPLVSNYFRDELMDVGRF